MERCTVCREERRGLEYGEGCCSKECARAWAIVCAVDGITMLLDQVMLKRDVEGTESGCSADSPTIRQVGAAGEWSIRTQVMIRAAGGNSGSGRWKGGEE